MILSRRSRQRSSDAAAASFRKTVAAQTAMFALIVVLFSSRQAQAFDTAHELAARCESVDTSTMQAGRDVFIPATKEALQCWGYMQAMQDLSVLADEYGRRIMGVCPNEQTTLLQLTHAFVAYARHHSDDLDNDAALTVIGALKEAFPCP
jgi:hypothetical protein